MYGAVLAFAAAVLFGASAPADKLLLRFFDPLQLAGLLYLGAAGAMVPVVVRERAYVGAVAVGRVNRNRLAGVVLFGGVIAPILLLCALRLAAAGAVSLLLNFEIVATAVLGTVLFREHLGGLGWLGVGGVVAASVFLSGAARGAVWVAALLVAAACTCWAIDNLLSALIDGMTPARSTLWKGAVAGVANLGIGLAVAPLVATAASVVAAIAIGAVSYGASIALHTAAAQRIGAVRAQAVFASAPFVGVTVSVVLLGERLTATEALAAALFLLSVVVLLAGRHAHPHLHGGAEHIHAHRHDDGHHLHQHSEPVIGLHTHWHQHEPVVHVHPHWPDLHHRHAH